MRIIGGEHRGTALASVGKGDAGAHLRPTSDRVRESIFNILSGGRFDDPITDAVVLDLFAGTGALGLEALSRGAAFVTFVDSGRTAQRLIRENIAKLQQKSNCSLISIDVNNLPDSVRPANLVFVDPPYGLDLGSKAITNAAAKGWIEPNALIVWEERTPQFAPAGFDFIEHRRYGDTHITFLQAGS